MPTNRLEAFSDGVIAILITIMVLELRVPHSPTLGALAELYPVFLSYVLSFIYLGIYWNNHHQLFTATEKVSGGVLWANNHLLFWLSLMPFATAWMGENHFESVPTAIYGVVLLGCAFAYSILVQAIIHAERGSNQRVAHAIRGDAKGNWSLVLYAIAIPLAFVNRFIADALYVLTAFIWLVPDRRFERRSRNQGHSES